MTDFCVTFNVFPQNLQVLDNPASWHVTANPPLLFGRYVHLITWYWWFQGERQWAFGIFRANKKLVEAWYNLYILSICISNCTGHPREIRTHNIKEDSSVLKIQLLYYLFLMLSLYVFITFIDWFKLKTLTISHYRYVCLFVS